MHRIRLYFGLGVLGLGLLVILGVFLAALHPILLVLLLLVPVAVVFFFKKHFNDPYIARDYKEAVVRQSLQYLDPSLAYEPEQHISYENYQASGLFTERPASFTGDDLITGNFKGVPVQLSELTALQLVNPKKKKYRVLFQGLFMVAEYPASFRGRTYILPDTLPQHLKYAGELARKLNSYRGIYVRAPEERFRRQYATYADEPLQAEQLLSTELMDKIQYLAKVTGGEISVSFIGNKIYLAANTNKELFKVDTARSLYSTGSLKNFYREFLSLFSLLEDLQKPTSVKLPDSATPAAAAEEETHDELPEMDFSETEGETESF